MGLKSYITDIATGLKAKVTNNNGEEDSALIVATRDLKTYSNEVRFFTNNTYGVDMNQDASAGGVPEEVHDGIDNIYWTGSIISGTKFTFNSADQNHTPAGAQSVKVDNPNINSTIDFAKGGDLDLSGYASLTMWIYVSSDWAAGDIISIYGWRAGAQVGIRVSLGDYFNYLGVGVWRKITIPLTDMNLSASTISSLRITNTARSGAKSPVFYLDDIEFEQTGTPIPFTVEPARGTWLHVTAFNISFVDAYAGTLADATMPSIPYNGFFGVADLDNGITYQRQENSVITASATIRRFINLMNYSHATLTGAGSDGTNSWATVLIQFTTPVILKSESKDKLILTLNDDLSGLLFFRVSAACKEESREQIRM